MKYVLFQVFDRFIYLEFFDFIYNQFKLFVEKKCLVQKKDIIRLVN